MVRSGGGGGRGGQWVVGDDIGTERVIRLRAAGGWEGDWRG